jgi:multidrug efflux pump subunit AcrA (membrane-fusion protein)
MRYWLLSLVVIALVVAGCGRHGEKPRKPAYSRAEVVRPRRKELVRTLFLSATVEALKKVDLCVRVPGEVRELSDKMDIGAKVKKGQVLVKLYVPDLEADLANKKVLVTEAERREELAGESLKVAIKEVTEVVKEHKKYLAEHAFSKQKLERIKELVRQKAQDPLVQQEMERQTEAAAAAIEANEAKRAKREARVAAARAELALAKQRIVVARTEKEKAEKLLSLATVTAPFDGVITRRWVDPGAVITGPNTPLLTVMETGKVRVLMDVPQRDVPLLNDRESRPTSEGKGDTVWVSLPVRNRITSGVGTINGSVGAGGANSPDDVKWVQRFLNRLAQSDMVINGKADDALVAAIKRFQRDFMAKPDGKLEPGSETWKRLFDASKHHRGKFKGTITRVSRSLDPITRTMRAEVELNNPDNELTPGMFGTAEVIVEALPNVITVPASAIVRKGEGEVEVFIVDNVEGEGEERHGVLRAVRVELGIDDGKEVEIKSGLKGDELVVARGASVMRPDDAVLAIEAP